jgi:hypothetical protein
MKSRSHKPEGLVLTILLLAACSNNQPGTLPHGAIGIGAASSIKQAISHRAASTDPDDYLYVGDGSAEIVRIYDYSHSDKPIGQIDIDPAGLCSDASGNVWIAGGNSEGYGLYEFRHDGSGPIAHLAFNGDGSCAVDPNSGDLAVASDGGRVDVYRKAQGKPKIYHDSNVTDFYYCAYDASGNLVVQGIKYVGQDEVLYDEIVRGSKQLQHVDFGRPFVSVTGGIAWDGKYFAVAYGHENTLYRYSIADLKATLVGQSEFQFPDYGFSTFAIHKHRLAVLGEHNISYNPSKIAKFPYPSGTRERHDQTTGLPRGITISVGTSDLK